MDHIINKTVSGISQHISSLGPSVSGLCSRLSLHLVCCESELISRNSFLRWSADDEIDEMAKETAVYQSILKEFDALKTLKSQSHLPELDVALPSMMV